MNAPTKSKWDAADRAYQKGVEAYIEFGKELAKLNASGTTQEEIGQRYEMEQPRVAEAIKVGQDRRIIPNRYSLLPKSVRSLYLLTTLDDEGFELLARPDTTQAKIIAYKQGLVAPPRVQEPSPARPISPAFIKGTPEYEKVHREVEHVPPQVDPRTWLRNYILSCSEDKILTLLERVRSIEHPDKGGSHELSTAVNDLIRRMKHE